MFLVKLNRFAPLFVAIALLLPAQKAVAGVGHAIASACLGPGTGEWLDGKQSFLSCCVEHILAGIPVLDILLYIGSIIDAYKGVGQPSINLLFATFDLGI